MTLAMAFKEPGPPEVLRPAEIDVPAPGPGEVRVAVRAAGAQPVDTLVRREGYTMQGADPRFSQIPGNEFSGVVESAGEGVADFAPGDEVIGFRTLGAYAQRVLNPADQLARKPAAMPWHEAGGLFSSGQTAYRTLKAIGVGPGDTVLINAAAGGVGTMAVQLARAWGATPIGTASERNHEYLRALGAVPVAYGNGLVDRVRAIVPDGPDAALDAIGGEALDASLELVADRQRIATIVEMDRIAELGLRELVYERSAERLAELAGMWERGELRVHDSRTYPLREAAAAHREIEGGHVRGKVVLTNNEEEER